MTTHEALLEIVEERSLTVKAGDVAGHQFHGNQYTQGGIFESGSDAEKMHQHLIKLGFKPKGSLGSTAAYERTHTGNTALISKDGSWTFRSNAPSERHPTGKAWTGSNYESFKKFHSISASLPGNRHAAADYSGDSMADRMREHDAIRTNTAISDPHQYMAHTASIAAYQATKDIKAGKVVHAEAAAAHDVAAKLHRALGNGEYADKHERHADYHRSK
jgi:hypothetical protein